LKRNQLLIFSLVLLLTSACASSKQSTGAADKVDLQLVQTYGPDVFYMRGTVPVEYQLVMTNRTGQPLTLRNLNLQTVGAGAYRLRTGDTPMNQPVAANGTTAMKLSMWGQSNGSYLRMSDPVTIRGIARFDSPSGPITKIFTQMVPQGS
jgi:hypothetical protein